MRFDGKVVIVTGGTRGIGAAISLAFAQRGASCVLNYRADEKEAKRHLARLPEGNHRLIKADISSLSECRRLIEFVVEQYGYLDILVNNAGIFQKHSIEAVTLEEWDAFFRTTFEVNLMGPARLMYLAATEMKKNDGGRIINISSRGAFRGEPDQPAYGASKAALNALGQSLAKKLGPDQIFIGTVAPGFVETDLAREALRGQSGEDIRNQSTLGRVARVEEVAYATCFLASEGAEFTTGTILDVNGASYLRQ